MNCEGALDRYTEKASYHAVLDNDDLSRDEAMEVAFRAAWALAKTEGAISPRGIMELARKMDEADGAQRAMASAQPVKEILGRDIADDTSVVGMGPVNLDVEMARAHGWSEEQIRRAWSVLEAVVKAEAEIAHLRHPELYETDEDGDVHFVGASSESTDAVCCECGAEFDFTSKAPYYQEPEVSSTEIKRLMSKNGAHAGYVLLGSGADGEPEILCENCGYGRDL